MLFQTALQLDKAFSASSAAVKGGNWPSAALRMRQVFGMALDCYVASHPGTYSANELEARSWVPGVRIRELLLALKYSEEIPSNIFATALQFQTVEIKDADDCHRFAQSVKRFIFDVIGPELVHVPSMSQPGMAQEFNRIWRAAEIQFSRQ